MLATANHANTNLRDALSTLGLTTPLIGDANAPHNAAMAFHEGRKLALSL